MHVVAGTIGSAQASGHGQRVLSAHRQPAASLAAPRQRRQPRQRRSLRVAAMDDELTQEELEAKVEAFMRRQAEIEGGEKTRTAEPGKVLGADEVSEEEAKRMCREIVGILRILKEQRDMTLNEVRLTVGIEDPRAREKRLMGMEDSSGISRDEMAVALMEVSEGRIPTDRIALRELCREISQWPALDEPTGVRFGRRKPIESPEVAIGGLSPAADDSAAAWWQPGKVRQPMGRDPNEQPRGLADQLPEWFGYGALYLVSIAPVLIAILAISILFFNSFR